MTCWKRYRHCVAHDVLVLYDARNCSQHANTMPTEMKSGRHMQKPDDERLLLPVRFKQSSLVSKHWR